MKRSASLFLFSLLLATPLVMQTQSANAATTGNSNATAVKAENDDTQTSSTVADAPYAVETTLPANSQVSLAGPAGFVYLYFNDQGVSNSQRGLVGDTSHPVDKILLSLQRTNSANAINYNTSGLFVRTTDGGDPDNQWIKVDTGVTVNFYANASDTTPTETLDSVTTSDVAATPLTINFVDSNGKALASPITIPLTQKNVAPDSEVASLISTLSTDLSNVAIPIDGYTLSSETNADSSVTYHYTKNSTDPTNPGTTTPSESSSSATTSSNSTPDTSVPGVVKGQAISATKKIGLYTSPTFKNSARQHWYTKQSRTNRPQFVVIGYARSKNGVLRYKVRDVNHTKTDGQIGYITANTAFVTPTYYQTQPKQVKVIGSHGLNAYRNVGLTGKARHYKHGQVLKVKAIRTHHLTTRLVLSNGQFISGNKTLVIKK